MAEAIDYAAWLDAQKAKDAKKPAPPSNTVQNYTKAVGGEALSTAAGFVKRPIEIMDSLYNLLTDTVPKIATGQLDLVTPAIEAVKKASPSSIAKTVGAMTIGLPATEAIAQGSFEPIQKDVGGTIFDLMLAPLNVIPAASGAMGLGAAARKSKILGPVAEPVGKVADIVGRKLIPKYMHTDEMQKSEALRQGDLLYNTVTKTQKAVDDFEALQATSPHGVRLLEPRFKKDKATGFVGVHPKDAALFRSLPPEAQTKILSVRQTIDDLDQLAADRGLIDLKRRRPGQYLHRMYETHFDHRAWVNNVKTNRPDLIDNAATWVETYMDSPTNPGFKASRAEAVETAMFILDGAVGDMARARQVGPMAQEINALLKTKRIPAPIKELLGPLPTSKWGVRAGQTVDDQVRMLATDAALDRMTSLKSFDGRPLIVKPSDKTAMAGADYLTLPRDLSSTQKWAGAQVHPDIYDAVVTMSSDKLTGTLQRLNQAWRVANVPANIPTHVNNILGSVGNSILLGNSMINPANTPFYADAIRDLVVFARDNQKLGGMAELAEAVRAGAVVPGFTHAELGNLYAKLSGSTANNMLDVFLDAMLGKGDTFVASGVRGAMSAYDLEDQVLRYATFLKNTRAGMSPSNATLLINKYTPNYEVSSQLGKFARGEATLGGIPAAVGPFVMGPFTSFPLEMMRIYTNASVEHPMRLLAAQSIPLTLAMAGATAAGMTPEEYTETLRNLPPHLKGKALIPMPGDQGVQWMDLTAAWPLASWYTQGGPGADLIASGPAATLYGMLPWVNHNARTGQPYYDPAHGDTFASSFASSLFELAPIPTFLKRGTERTKAALDERPVRRHGPVQDPKKVIEQTMVPLLDTRSQGELEDSSRAYQRGELGDIRRGTRSINRNPAMGDSDKERRLRNIDDYREKVR